MLASIVEHVHLIRLPTFKIPTLRLQIRSNVLGEGLEFRY